MKIRDRLDLFEGPGLFAIRCQLVKSGNSELLKTFEGGPFELRRQVHAAAYAKFMEDGGDGTLGGFLQWLVDHKEEIIALINLLMMFL